MAVKDLKNKGRDLFRRKQYELAIDAYLEYLRFEPDDEEATEGFFQAAKKNRELKGKGLFGGMFKKIGVTARDPKKRINQALRALSKAPENKGLLMALGDAALDAGAMGTAAVAFNQAAEADPEDGEPFKRLGMALGRKGRIEEALNALRKACEINPKDQEANKLRKNLAAEGALKISGYETAKSSRELIKDKDVAEELETEVRMQLTPEHAATEIDKLEEEVAANPDDPRLLVRLADLYEHKGDEVNALDRLEKALVVDGENYDLSVRIGDKKLRKVTDAYKTASEALKAAPDDEGAKSAFATAKEALVAAKLVEHGRRVKEHPLDLTERFHLGRWQLEAGDVDNALAEFQQTVRDPNRKVDSLRFQAKCFEKKNLLALAVKKLEEAAQSFPTLASPKAKEVNYDYGDLLERQGHKDKAREVFEKIVEAEANYRDSLDRLSKLSN